LKASTVGDVRLQRSGAHREPDAGLGDIRGAAGDDLALADQLVDGGTGDDRHVGSGTLGDRQKLGIGRLVAGRHGEPGAGAKIRRHFQQHAA
jgi:hypothetical protein